MLSEPGSEAVARFAEAGVAFVAGGRGQALVDAAAMALADGLDSPTLRMLAGAPRANADEEAADLAPAAFQELGLDVPPRFSIEAYTAFARITARDHLAKRGSLRDAARVLYGLYVAADWAPELSDFAALADLYDLLEEGVIEGQVADADRATVEALERLASGAGVEPHVDTADILRRAFTNGRLTIDEPHA